MWLKTSEDLNLLSCTASINIDNTINFCNECADYFGEIGLLQNQYKTHLRPDAEPVVQHPRRLAITWKDKLRENL